MIAAAFKSLGRQYLDVTMASGRNLTVRIVERPGRWMSQPELEAMSADLRQIASKTLAEGALTYGVFAADRDRMEHSIITLVRRRDGTPVAFNALAIMTVDTQPEPTDVLHLGLVMVDPAERSKSLSWVLYGLTCFMIFFRRQFRSVWISNVTQVPAVIGMVSGMFSGIWPGPQSERQTLMHLMLARRIMADHRHVFGVGPDAGWDEERFVITNAYTGGSDDLKKTWDEAPKHRDAQFNAFCAEALDYERGDDILQLGQMDMAAIRRYLSRDVPKSAIAGVLFTGAMAALGRVILPMIYWMDARKDWSILRASRSEK